MIVVANYVGYLLVLLLMALGLLDYAATSALVVLGSQQEVIIIIMKSSVNNRDNNYCHYYIILRTAGFAITLLYHHPAD
jgi:hypothetical protein